MDQHTLQMWETKQYAELVKYILMHGEKRPSRAGNVYSMFGCMLQLDMQYGFPLLYGRKMFYKPVLGELAAFVRGPKHVEDFKQFGCNYWDDWAVPDGDIKVDYGNKWIDWNGHNQLETLIDTIKNNPNDRRMLITGWDPSNLRNLSLPCCHLLYQWYVREGTYLDMIWYQRSVDTMVGLPSDIILAAAWNALLANETGLKPGRLTFMLGDTHIYENHIAGANDYIRSARNLVGHSYASYSLLPEAKVQSFIPSDFTIDYFNSKEAIKFELNV